MPGAGGKARKAEHQTARAAKEQKWEAVRQAGAAHGLGSAEYIAAMNAAMGDGRCHWCDGGMFACELHDGVKK